MSFEKPTCDLLLVINSNLGPISHCLATIHPLQMTTVPQTSQLCIAVALIKLSLKRDYIALAANWPVFTS